MINLASKNVTAFSNWECFTINVAVLFDWVKTFAVFFSCSISRIDMPFQVFWLKGSKLEIKRERNKERTKERKRAGRGREVKLERKEINISHALIANIQWKNPICWDWMESQMTSNTGWQNRSRYSDSFFPPGSTTIIFSPKVKGFKL